jgi:MerR family transcriptional regulator, redox-sensitive transcriptional activator SoxR
MERAPEPLISIQEVARISGVPASALRYYESLALITSHRTGGAHRRYRLPTMQRLSYIVLAQRAGFCLDEIVEQLARLPKDSPPTRKQWAQLKPKWLERIDDKIDDLKQLKGDLDRCTGAWEPSIAECEALFRDVSRPRKRSKSDGGND